MYKYICKYPTFYYLYNASLRNAGCADLIVDP